MSAKLDVLLIDDDPISNFITSELIVEAKLPVKLITIADSREALEYMLSRYNNATEPIENFMVLLDLSMPGLDGFEVLQSLNERGIKQYLNVVVLTSSDHMKDRKRAHDLGVNGFLQKPLNTQQLKPLLETQLDVLH